MSSSDGGVRPIVRRRKVLDLLAERVSQPREAAHRHLRLLGAILSPSRSSRLPRCLASLLRRHLRSPSPTTLEPALPAERDSGGVLPLVRIGRRRRRCLPRRLVHDLTGNLV